MQPPEPENLSELLRAKGALACPVCGACQASVSAHFLPLTGIQSITAAERDAPDGLDIACVICSECGFVRMHELPTLLGVEPAG